MRILVFCTLLMLVVALAFWRGRRDERIAAITCVVGTVLTVLAWSPHETGFGSFEANALAIDVAVLAVFVALALLSDRFWPMWVAGLQLVASSVHLLKLFHPELMSFVFGVALAFWSYPILLLIALGALRTRMIERWREAQVIAGRGLTI